MNFQEKLFETSAELRERAQAFANSALATARTQADQAARRVEQLKGSFAVLNTAGREFNQVARRHAIRFAGRQLWLDRRTETFRKESKVLRQPRHGVAQRQDFLLVRHFRPDSIPADAVHTRHHGVS